MALLNNADIVFSTLAFSGSQIFSKITCPFDTVVIDEAAQALEPSCLVPLLGGVKQVCTACFQSRPAFQFTAFTLSHLSGDYITGRCALLAFDLTLLSILLLALSHFTLSPHRLLSVVLSLKM